MSIPGCHGTSSSDWRTPQRLPHRAAARRHGMNVELEHGSQDPHTDVTRNDG